MTTSSAKPGALFYYADLQTRSGAAFMPHAETLSAALSHFLATCTEFRPAGVSLELAGQLRTHAANTHFFHWNTQGAWARSTSRSGGPGAGR